MVRVTKCPIPIIWLDTSLIIKIAKARDGEALTGGDKYLKLYETIFKQVRQKKLLCPKGDQDIEFEVGQRLVDECHRIQANLSYAIHSSTWSMIRDVEILRVMVAHIGDLGEVVFGYKDAFPRDPILQWDQSFPVSVRFESPPPVLDLRKRTKMDVRSGLEQVRRDRVARGMSFEQALVSEYDTPIQILLSVRKELEAAANESREPDANLVLQLHEIKQWEQAWDNHGGHPRGIAGLLEFWKSDDYRSIPYVDIACKLLAYILTRDQKVKSGDWMDVEQLAAMLPFSNWVVTDNAMQRSLVKLELDKKFNVTILAARDLGRLICELENL